jgi:hypothetical protein
MILLLDNYDSFVFNLARYFERLGHETVVAPSSKIDVSGGHHDAGDYSKYTINSAALIHSLVFAVDGFAGVGQLDNLGLPESGDGRSDLLQEAKWEADFLARMQDADGGFYFLVYPRDRKYEDNVLPDHGDRQVVFPKTTAVTAAAVGALAQMASSPLFQKQFPEAARMYLERARQGWGFLQRALERYGWDGSYQKITHYGDTFDHDDEMAWALTELFLATGQASYQQLLKSHFDPAGAKSRRWGWWRLYESYGNAIRSYAFAVRTGRASLEQLDPELFKKCQQEIVAGAQDQLGYAQANAYGTSFALEDKYFRNAGWYFSSDRAFDLTVAYQLEPRSDFLEAVLSNLNYEAGCNPVNVSYVSGLGSRRQREFVHQYAQNDRRVLPPSGIPLGNVQAGFSYVATYQRELGALSFPPDGDAQRPYPLYDRWGDTFNLTTEFVAVNQARSLGSLAYWFAQSPLKDQLWQSCAGQIRLKVLSTEPVRVQASLRAPGLDLQAAQIVWEAREQEAFSGQHLDLAPIHPGTYWIEAEALLPDGRRIVAQTNLSTSQLPEETVQLSASLERQPDGSLILHISGDNDSSAQYRIDVSTDGIEWNPAYTGRAGPINYSYEISAGSDAQFFRAVKVPNDIPQQATSDPVPDRAE